jgi:hypothetical protein
MAAPMIASVISLMGHRWIVAEFTAEARWSPAFFGSGP